VLSRQNNTHSRSNDRGRAAGARQAAEALFAAKPPVSPPSAPDPAADQPPRKPRVLRAIARPSGHVEDVKALVSREPAIDSSIPSAHLARIRTWLRYGMTIAQVAAIYGVNAGEIANLLGKA
jgi:hypothetical protein